MSDRWNPTIRTVTTVKPPKFFVPSGPPPGVPAIGDVEQLSGRSWTTRRRGDLEGVVKHSYRCPVHGLQDVMVPRAAVPDAVACSVLTDSVATNAVTGEAVRMSCGAPATWAGSSCGIGHAAGEVES